MRPRKLTLGDFEIFSLRDGFFSLDGGAMFGVVPKTLWQRKYPADRYNRIRLSLNSLLIRTPRALVLIETGIGGKEDVKFSEIYGVEREPGLIPSLTSLGFCPEDIDFVINTHLHFDHCGGNTVRNDKGEVVPAFPRAKYIIQKGEWDSARNPNDREKQSYLGRNFLPLEKFERLELVEGNHMVTEGVEVLFAPGHTAHHQCVKIHSGGETVLFMGDLVPTSAHIGLPYIMSYDLFPLDTLKTKKKLYEQVVAGSWTLALVHDPRWPFGKVGKVREKYEFLPPQE